MGGRRRRGGKVGSLGGGEREREMGTSGKGASEAVAGMTAHAEPTSFTPKAQAHLNSSPFSFKFINIVFYFNNFRLI